MTDLKISNRRVAALAAAAAVVATTGGVLTAVAQVKTNIMRPCCLSPRGSGTGRGTPGATNAAANDEALAAVKTPADSAKLPFGLRAQFASAAASAPNPKHPPLYLDLPIGEGPKQLARYFRLAGLRVNIEIRDRENPIRVLVDSPFYEFGAEYTIALTMRNFRQETAQQFAAEYVSFSHIPDDVSEYELAFGCPVRADQNWGGFAVSQ